MYSRLVALAHYFRQNSAWQPIIQAGQQEIFFPEKSCQPMDLRAVHAGESKPVPFERYGDVDDQVYFGFCLQPSAAGWWPF